MPKFAVMASRCGVQFFDFVQFLGQVTAARQKVLYVKRIARFATLLF
jgi:hypothetical protein